MIITMLIPDNSAVSRCMIGALKNELHTHEFRGPLRAIALADGDKTELEALVNTSSREKSNIYLIWLPSNDKMPNWTTTLYQRLKKHTPDAYFVWIVWLPGVPMPQGAEIFNQPGEGSFILNIDHPKGWPTLSGTDFQSKASHLIQVISGNPDNHFRALLEWLKILIG